MTRWLHAVVVVVAFAFMSTGTVARGAEDVAVQASSFRFCADSVVPCLPTAPLLTTTVDVGSTITWTYRDLMCEAIVPCPGHNVVFADGTKGPIAKGLGTQLLTRRFAAPGRYAYTCTIHAGAGMTGEVVVEGAEPAPPPAGRGPRGVSLPSTGGDVSLPAVAAVAAAFAFAAVAWRRRSGG